MSEKTWKKNERRLAEILGGQRVPITGRSRGDVPDIRHEWLSIEAKHRKTIPAWLLDAIDQAKAAGAGTDRLPIAILHQAGTRHDRDIVCMTLADFRSWFGELPKSSTAIAEEAA